METLRYGLAPRYSATTSKAVAENWGFERRWGCFLIRWTIILREEMYLRKVD